MNATVRFIDSPIVFGHPPRLRCAGCRDHLHAEDYRPDLGQEHFVAALHDRYGPNVCAGCMDNIDKEGMPE